MKTKTSELIEKTLREELNQQIPTQPQQETQPQAQPQPQPKQQEEQQKVEVYIPLHDGRFTNRIFTTTKNIVVKVLNDSIGSDMNTLEELENNPSMYHEVSV
jgi:lactate dehydrogenase-like 2-hydroxyacid dehydrogenase